jgi:MFS family permease
MSSRAQRIQERAFDRRWIILTVLCLSLMLTMLDLSILNVALPTIQKDLDASASDLQWIVDAYTLVFAGLLLTAGSLGDRFGRRGALQIGFAIFGGASIAAALSTSAGALMVSRACMGIGGALIMPATLSIITNVFPVHERSRAIGVWAGVGGLGAVLGPLAGGVLLEHFAWGSVFLVNLPIVLVGVLAGFVLIPTSKDPQAPRLDPLGAALSIASLSVILYAIIEAPDLGWGDRVTIGRFAVGTVLLAVFIGWELHTDHARLLRRGGVSIPADPVLPVRVGVLAPRDRRAHGAVGRRAHDHFAAVIEAGPCDRHEADSGHRSRMRHHRATHLGRSAGRYALCGHRMETHAHRRRHGPDPGAGHRIGHGIVASLQGGGRLGGQ